MEARDASIVDTEGLEPLAADLKAANVALQEIDDQIRACERTGDFGPRFVEMARSVYRHNDRRAAIKRQINERLGSEIVEEKSFTAIEPAARWPGNDRAPIPAMIC